MCDWHVHFYSLIIKVAKFSINFLQKRATIARLRGDEGDFQVPALFDQASPDLFKKNTWNFIFVLQPCVYIIVLYLEIQSFQCTFKSAISKI